MTNSNHTPWPWVVDYSGPARIAIADTLGNEVAFCSLQNEDGDTDEANARLIAAAPELLEALQAILVAVDCGNHEQKLERSNPLCTTFARLAISKAKGQQCGGLNQPFQNSTFQDYEPGQLVSSI